MSIKWCERPGEGPVQSQKDLLWRCPEPNGDHVGWADPSFVHCTECAAANCLTRGAIDGNHALSQTNVVNFGFHPDTTPSGPRIDGVSQVAKIKR